MAIAGTITPTPFTALSETAAQATASPIVPAGFDANMAMLLAQACQLTYQQYQLPGAPVNLGQLTPVCGAAGYTQVGSALTAPEPIGLGAAQPGSAGWVTVPYGFAFTAVDSAKNALFNVIAFRGTQSYEEWVCDADALPAFFGLVSSGHFIEALVHGGFYGVYNAGGEKPPTAGTLADQVRTLLSLFSDKSVPLYLTGHSLGGALCELCGADIGQNCADSFSKLFVYSLASPQVAAGSSMLVPVTYFQDLFQKSVASGGAYRTVNAADLVPILPPSIGSPGGMNLTFAPSIPAANTVSFLAQQGNIGDNHSSDLYAGFLDQLSSTVLQAQSAGETQKIAVPALGPTAEVPAASS